MDTERVKNLLENVNWANIENFLKGNSREKIAGYAMSYANMNLVMVLKAGHVVLKYQPLAVLDMALDLLKIKAGIN